MQHVMIATMGSNVSSEYVGGTVFPDAIRAYSGPRQLSHFERSDDGEDSSWWHMPTDMRHISKELVDLSLKKDSHLAKNAPAPFGQETDVSAFLKHNSSMSYQKEMYAGVLAHLSVQDMVFDAFVRHFVVDMSEMANGRLYVQDAVNPVHIPDDVHTHSENGRLVFDSDSDARRLVTHVEMQGIYILAKTIYAEYGITCDQAWFDNEVAEEVFEAYPKDLAEKTMKFMKLDDDIAKYIHQHDFSNIEEGPLPSALYNRMYQIARQGTAMVYKTGKPVYHSMQDVKF